VRLLSSVHTLSLSSSSSCRLLVDTGLGCRFHRRRFNSASLTMNCSEEVKKRLIDYSKGQAEEGVESTSTKLKVDVMIIHRLIMIMTV
jgi:hypothetical protein